MTTIREEIRKLAEEAADSYLWNRCESAILAGVKLVLEREPSNTMWKAGGAAFYKSKEQTFLARVPEVYRAMTRELLKELE